MRISQEKRVISLIGSLLAVVMVSVAADGALWQAGQAQLRAICPMTIGGSFEAKTTALTGTLTTAASRPSSLSGELVVDLKTLDTGIGLRNEHLRNNYLEVGSGEGFDRAVLSNIDLGQADPATVQGRTKFTATLLLHGTKKTISGEADIKRMATSLRVNARFPLTISDYGIAKPRYLGVGVRDQIQVDVTFIAAPAAAPQTR